MTAINGYTPTEYTRMVRDLAKPGQAVIDGLTPFTAHLLHMAVGVVGEVGEKLEAILNNDPENLREECGDLEFYLEGLAFSLYDGQTLHKPVPEFTDQQVDDYLKTLPTDEHTEKLHIVACRLLDYAKKASVYAKELDLFNTALQVASLRCLMDVFYFQNGSWRGEFLDHNMTKLLKGDKARYKSGAYSDQQAQVRTDKQE